MSARPQLFSCLVYFYTWTPSGVGGPQTSETKIPHYVGQVVFQWRAFLIEKPNYMVIIFMNIFTKMANISLRKYECILSDKEWRWYCLFDFNQFVCTSATVELCTLCAVVLPPILCLMVSGPIISNSAASYVREAAPGTAHVEA